MVTLPGKTDRSEPRAGQEAWVLATLPRALAYAPSLLRDRALAEDVAHDCYVRLLAKAGTYDLPRDGTKLLYKAITNACIDKNYRDRTHGEPGGRSDSASRRNRRWPTAGHATLTSWPPIASWKKPWPSSSSRLTVAQRGALELKSLGYSLDEIAEALGTSPSNAGVLVHRARKILADRLARFLEERTR